MNPEFWLVLLRLLRVPLTALLGTLPLTLLALQAWPSDVGRNLLAGLFAGPIAALAAVPSLALDRAADAKSDTRLRLGLLGSYLLIGVPVAAVLVTAAVGLATGELRDDVGSFLISTLRAAKELFIILHLYLSTPLLADQLNHRFAKEPIGWALPFGFLGAGYVVAVWVFNQQTEALNSRDLLPDHFAMMAALLLFVVAWPLGLSAGRAIMQELVKTLERAARSAERRR